MPATSDYVSTGTNFLSHCIHYGLSSIQVSVAVWEEGEARPHELFEVRVDPARALLRNPFQEKKWRNFKFHLSNIFGSSSSASKVHTIDVLLTEDGTKVVDTWLVVQSLGSGHTRDMALDRYSNCKSHSSSGPDQETDSICTVLTLAVPPILQLGIKLGLIQ